MFRDAWRRRPAAQSAGVRQGRGADRHRGDGLDDGSGGAAASGRRAQKLQSRGLTHIIGPDFPTYDGSSNLEVETLVTVAKDGYNMNRWLLVEHTGTHMDAPIHFGEGVHLSAALL